MKLHNDIVLKISSFFKKHTLLHYLLKRNYFKLNYFLFGNKKFKYEIKNGFRCDLDLDSQDKEYFIGYYHHIPWSYDDKFLAINSIADKEKLTVNILDLDSKKIIFSDSTDLWNFQQGPMLGWLPSSHTVYYNKVIDGIHKTVLYNIVNKKFSYYKLPIQTVHPNSNSYLSINYSKLYEVNRDYGYKHQCKEMSKRDIGIWICSFDNRNPRLLVSIESMNEINPKYKISIKNEFNHCLFSNNGEHFIFIYRYTINKTKYSKLILANFDSKNIKLRVVNDSFISHMCWIDNDNIFYFGDSSCLGRGYYIYNIPTKKAVKVMQNNLNDGHPSISTEKKWIVIDSYPDSEYNCHLYLYNVETKQNIDIGIFKSNIKLHGYNRCDLHPRWNNSGDKVIIDSSHEGKRYPLLIDLGEIVNE